MFHVEHRSDPATTLKNVPRGTLEEPQIKRPTHVPRGTIHKFGSQNTAQVEKLLLYSHPKTPPIHRPLEDPWPESLPSLIKRAV